MSLITDRLGHQYEFRSIREADLDQIHEIEKSAYQQPWERRLIEDSLQAPMTYSKALFTPQGAVAYAIYQVVFSEGHLLNLAVAPGSQKRGLGEKLLDMILDDSRDRGAISFFLEVRPSNEAAIHLYQKKSFKPLMTRERYYSDGEAALIMVVDLARIEADSR